MLPFEIEKLEDAVMGFGNGTVWHFDEISDIEIEECPNASIINNSILSPNAFREQTLTIENAEVSEEFMKHILSLDTSADPDSYTAYLIKLEPARKHRKKRIQKKWIKRYGFKEVVYMSDGWEFVAHEDDGTFEFKKRMNRTDG